MSPHDWLSLADTVGTTIGFCFLIFCLFGGIGVTERIIRGRALRKDRRRRDNLAQHNLTLERAQEIINRRRADDV